MRKLWSISTTVRNPYRIKDFLRVLKELEGTVWNKESQCQFQILLIQRRFYTPTLKGLGDKLAGLLIDPEAEITFKKAKEIFECKNYRDPDMRGRNSYKPLEKFGGAYIVDNKVKITEFGNMLLDGKIDVEDFWLRSLLHFQYPNPLSSDFTAADGYDTKPFVTTLHLINRVNQLCKRHGYKTKGISKEEFAIFGLSLIDWKSIDQTAADLLSYRIKHESLKSYEEKKNFRIDYSKSRLKNFTNYTEKNLRDYSDNAIRYFRITKYIYIRGGGYYIDLEPRRHYEIHRIFETEDGSSDHSTGKDAYLEMALKAETYKLPWENLNELNKIAQGIVGDIQQMQRQLRDPAVTFLPFSSLAQARQRIPELRQLRSDLQARLLKQKYADIAKAREIVIKLKNIQSLHEKPSIALERYVHVALNIINDALQIKSNAPLGDDNVPIFTAPANMPDIECCYAKFRSICEVTTLRDRTQWFNEGQPVMRHLRDYEDKYSKDVCYCLFVSPRTHRDTVNTFWTAVRHEYEGRRQRIIPLTIIQLSEILEVVICLKERGKPFTHEMLQCLFDTLLDIENYKSSIEWSEGLAEKFQKWKSFILS